MIVIVFMRIIANGISITKWCSHKAHHMIASLSDGNPRLLVVVIKQILSVVS